MLSHTAHSYLRLSVCHSLLSFGTHNALAAMPQRMHSYVIITVAMAVNAPHYSFSYLLLLNQSLCFGLAVWGSLYVLCAPWGKGPLFSKAADDGCKCFSIKAMLNFVISFAFSELRGKL
ncbi:hypothetical protein ILYODFUR_024636 [Ilyodon furcidens]|uniref:Uncharacterized protein n=1 Tax=Ilyodon furcidens TaxID=33524 RepID=A0ABV0U066_9TELE